MKNVPSFIWNFGVKSSINPSYIPRNLILKFLSKQNVDLVIKLDHGYLKNLPLPCTLLWGLHAACMLVPILFLRMELKDSQCTTARDARVTRRQAAGLGRGWGSTKSASFSTFRQSRSWRKKCQSICFFPRSPHWSAEEGRHLETWYSSKTKLIWRETQWSTILLM